MTYQLYVWLQANTYPVITHVTRQGVTERLAPVLQPLLPLHFSCVLGKNCNFVCDIWWLEESHINNPNTNTARKCYNIQNVNACGIVFK